MLRKKIIIVSLILITAITAIIMFSNFGGNTSKAIDPVTQKPIAAKNGDGTVIVRGMWLGDFKNLTKSETVLVNDVAYKVEYLDDFGSGYALRNVKHSADGKYIFTSDPAETAFVISGTVTSKDEELIQVSSQIQPTVTLHGTVTAEYFTHSANSTFRVNGQDVSVTQGEGNNFTLVTNAILSGSYNIRIAAEDEASFMFAGNKPEFVSADLSKDLQVGDIRLVPKN